MPLGNKRKPGVFDALLATQQLGSNDLAQNLINMGAPVGATNLVKDLTDPLKALNGVNRYVPETAGFIGDILEAIGRPSSISNAAHDQGPGVFGGSMPVTRNSQGQQFGSDMRDAIAPHVNTSDPNAPFLPPATQQAIIGGIRDDISQRGILGVADPTDFAGVLGGAKAAKSFIDMAQNVPTPRASGGRKLMARPAKGDAPEAGLPRGDAADQSDLNLTTRTEQQIERLRGEGQSLPVDPMQNSTGLNQPHVTSVTLRNMTEPNAIYGAKLGVHLKQGADGQYVGAPRGVNSPETLQAMRDAYDAQLRNGALGADWYDRSRQGMIEMTGDPLATSEIHPALNRGDAASDVIGVTSAQRTPEVNFGLGLSNLNQAAAGAPISGGMPAQMNVVRETLEEGVRDQEKLLKLGVFGRNINPNNPYAVTGVNDIWHARAFGFKNADGTAWEAGLSPAQHAFLDGETLLAVQRANDAQVFGKTDWNAASAQAAPWIEGKAQGLVEKKASAKMRGDEKSGKPVRSMQQAMQDVTVTDGYTIQDARAEAAKTYIDFFDKHTAFTSIEQQPGVATGHLPGLQDAGLEGRQEFFDTFNLNDEHGRSRMHSNIGMQVRPSKESQGFFVNSEGGTEVNPSMTARPLVGLKTEGSIKTPDAPSEALTEGANTLLASMLGQESIGRHKVIEQGMGATGGSAQALRFDLPGPSTPDQLQKLDTALKSDAVAKFNVGSNAKPATLNIGGAQVDTGDGVTSLSFGTEGGQATAGGLKKLEAMLEEEVMKIYPNASNVRRVAAPGGLSGGTVGDKPTINAEFAGQGKTVEHVMEILNSPEAPRLIEVFDHADTQKMAGELFDRNENAAKTFGAPRQDIQNWLALIRDGRGREALSLVGKMALPATLGPVMAELLQGQKGNE